MATTSLHHPAVIPDIERRLTGLRPLIGNTPLLAIDCTLDGRQRTIFAKAENLSLTGSIKDRMAFHILSEAYAAGRLHPGDRIVEATSGNTGISFSALGRALGHPVTIFMPDWMSAERQKLIRSFGADIVLVSAAEGGFLGSIARTEEMAAAASGIFLPRQFDNQVNVNAHARTTGPEIWSQLLGRSLQPDAFVAGVGTGGTVMGVGEYLRFRRPSVRVHPVEPSNSPTLSTGHKVGKHRIQGISDEFVPSIVELAQLDEILAVDDGDAITMAGRLAAELGLGVGISSGANFLAALLASERLGSDAVVVTVFPDSNKKYLSTDLMKDEPVREGFLSPRVRLGAWEALPRVCQACYGDFPTTELPIIQL